MQELRISETDDSLYVCHDHEKVYDEDLLSARFSLIYVSPN